MSLACDSQPNGMDATGTMTVAWSDVENAHITVTLMNCISLNPWFVNPSAGDYHERSRGGSWHGGLWTPDIENSPCIDSGYKYSPFDLEPQPNGNRVNMGAYGNTAQATKSPPGAGTIIAVR